MSSASVSNFTWLFALLPVLSSFVSLFKLFIFRCTGSSLLHGLFSSCREQRLLSSCDVGASHCGGFLLRSIGSRALGLQ